MLGFKTCSHDKNRFQVRLIWLIPCLSLFSSYTRWLVHLQPCGIAAMCAPSATKPSRRGTSWSATNGLTLERNPMLVPTVPTDVISGTISKPILLADTKNSTIQLASNLNDWVSVHNGREVRVDWSWNQWNCWIAERSVNKCIMYVDFYYFMSPIVLMVQWSEIECFDNYSA